MDFYFRTREVLIAARFVGGNERFFSFFLCRSLPHVVLPPLDLDNIKDTRKVEMLGTRRCLLDM